MFKAVCVRERECEAMTDKEMRRGACWVACVKRKLV